MATAEIVRVVRHSEQRSFLCAPGWAALASSSHSRMQVSNSGGKSSMVKSGVSGDWIKGISGLVVKLGIAHCTSALTKWRAVAAMACPMLSVCDVLSVILE